VLAVAALLSVRFFLAKGAPLAAFAASCVTILGVVFTGVIGLFPNLIPSSLDPLFSLSIYNSSSSAYTLRIMTLVAFIFVPIVIAYKIWVYRIFRGRVTAEGVALDHEAY
jgi:cytochrome d ubiquinol oxidase subunit II